jgi:hypothetical protein
LRNANKVVLADRSDLDGVGKLVGRRSGVGIGREELLGGLGPEEKEERDDRNVNTARV